VPYKDLREFISQIDALKALRHIEGADARHEIGGITEVAAGMADCPALLFDHIKGYASGFRVLTNAVISPQRAALALGIETNLRPLDGWRSARRWTLSDNFFALTWG
jgi:4-hydroxy-3-polyprenylbenzoate decarboxylase